MLETRIIPCLLLSGNSFVKTKQFKERRYLGDPLNIVKIFNDKEVDELIILDIDATRNNCEPNYQLLEEIAGEAFMPIGYGGGVKNVEQASRIMRLGIEKIIINTAAVTDVSIINSIVEKFGSQAVVGSVDVKKSFFNRYEIVSKSGTIRVDVPLLEHVERMVAAGVGEVFVNSVDRDGMMSGYDIPLINKISSAIKVPVIACGGAGSIQDLRDGVKLGGASAVAAGSLFVFYGKLKSVLINYPTGERL